VGYGVAQTIGAVLLAVAVRSRVHEEGTRIRDVTLPVLRAVAATVVASGVVYALVRAVGPEGVARSIAAVAVGGAVLATMALLVLWGLGGPAPLRTLRSLGGDPGRGSAAATLPDGAA
jgi:hypothetical protein